MSKIKWGQRCIARRFDNCNEIRGKYINKECIVTGNENYQAEVVVAFETGQWIFWPISALEPIPETPNVWWPRVGSKVMHDGKVKQITFISPMTHQLDGDEWVGITQISPVPITEITPEEAIALLEQHTGKSFTIKSK